MKMSVLSDLLFSCTILLVHVFLWISAPSSFLQRSAAHLRAFHPQKPHWNNISSEPCCKAGNSVRVINEVPLDSLISKAFYNKIMLFMNNPLCVRNYFKSNPPQKLIYTITGWKFLISASMIHQTLRLIHIIRRLVLIMKYGCNLLHIIFLTKVKWMNEWNGTRCKSPPDNLGYLERYFSRY